MGNSQVLDFINNINKNNKLKEMLTKIATKIENTKNPEEAKAALVKELIPLAKSEGYNITEKEFEDYFLKQQNQSTELSDDDLQNASGGLSFRQFVGSFLTGFGLLGGAISGGMAASSPPTK